MCAPPIYPIKYCRCVRCKEARRRKVVMYQKGYGGKLTLKQLWNNKTVEINR